MKDSSQEESDGERGEKRFKRRRSMDFLRNTFGVGSSTETAKPMFSSSNVEKRKSGGFIGKSDFANDFEQEMIAALGLSPTKPGPEESSAKHVEQSKDESKGDILATRAVTDAERELPRDKSLPVLPPPSSNGPVPAEATGQKSQLSMGMSRPMTPSIRPVFDEDVKPATPPKDVPPKDLPPKDLPPKDTSTKEASLIPQPSQGQRQPSVSTLGADEKDAGASEEETETPPSPIPDTITTKKAEDPAYDKPLPQARPSDTPLPHENEDNTGFAPIPRPPSSAEILESKRRSISGLPPSAPGVQSPLRNEVRYSPGTRSSMLSFGSFGRQSQSRPATPANELSSRAGSGSPVPNGESKMDKLKIFGRGRRASVGDLLTGLQDNIQGSIQGLPEGGKRKRTFNRISVCFLRSWSIVYLLMLHRACSIVPRIPSLRISKRMTAPTPTPKIQDPRLYQRHPPMDRMGTSIRMAPLQIKSSPQCQTLSPSRPAKQRRCHAILAALACLFRPLLPLVCLLAASMARHLRMLHPLLNILE